MSRLLKTLFAGLEYDGISINTVNNWATELISELEAPAIWLMDLLGCTSNDCILNILRGKIKEIGPILDDEYAELCLGFTYLEFKKRNISLHKLESNILDIVDGSSVHGIDPEKVYSVFKDNSMEVVIREIDLLLGSFSKKSIEYKEYTFSNISTIEEQELLTE